MSKFNKIPDRWTDYTPFGEVIKGTRILPLKVPLKPELCAQVPEDQRFTPDDFLDQLKDRNYNLGQIVDLTATTRYYDGSTFEDRDVQYVKVFTKGHVVPSPDVIQRFSTALGIYEDSNPNSDSLIGVHCTHGVNRSGYLICRYLIDHKGFEPEAAIAAFAEARGYPIERKNYLQDLLGQTTEGPNSSSSNPESETRQMSHGGPYGFGDRTPNHHIPHNRYTHEHEGWRNNSHASHPRARHFPPQHNGSVHHGPPQVYRNSHWTDGRDGRFMWGDQNGSSYVGLDDHGRHHGSQPPYVPDYPYPPREYGRDRVEAMNSDWRDRQSHPYHKSWSRPPQWTNGGQNRGSRGGRDGWSNVQRGPRESGGFRGTHRSNWSKDN